MLKLFLSGLTDLIFPRNCILCHQYDEETNENPLCRSCQEKIPYNHPPFCVRCSRHLEAYSPEGLCHDCQKRLPDFDLAWGFTLYKPPMRELIQSFKFQNKTCLRKTFTHIAQTFLERYPLSFQEFDAIIPMPLTPTRLRERGYNQALLLAEGLSQILRLPCLTDQLERVRHTPRQSDLGEKERWTNILGAFRMKPLSAIAGKKIILVDDLLTTGSTASQAAQTLMAAGAVKVGIIVLSLA